MRIGIGKIAKELNVKHHVLHTWENRGWLGYTPVLKDPENNNQRVYSEEQLERIRFIHGLIEAQRARGVKRTDIAEVEQALLDKYGGEITKMQEEATLLPSTVDEFHHLLLQNNKMLADMADQLKKSDEDRLAMIAEYEKEKLAMMAQHQKEMADMQREMQMFKEKLDVAVEYIQKEEAKEPEKKGFWQRILGQI